MKKILSNALIITILAVLSLILFSCKSKQVKVSFETFGGNKIETVSVAQFGKLENIPTPIKDGYTFIDWYTDSLLQFPFNRQEELLRNMTLYAGYSINSYTITFVTNTATIIEPITLEYASAIPAIEIPYKEGHIFKGWYLDADFKTPNSYVYMTNRDITLYASFQADILSIFFYDADSDLYKTVNVSYGDSLVSSKIPGVPVKEGYTGVWDTTDFSSITQELHIYPVYTVRTFVVTYRFSNSTGSIFEGLTQNVEYGALLSAPSSYPVLEGYTFTLDSYDYNVPVTKDVTIILIYARNTYQVRFFGLYGNVIATYNVEHGNNATIPEIPQIGGYHYVGLDATTTNITSSIDIHLLYEVNNYTIVLYALGGEFASNSSDTVILTIPYLSNIGILEKPTKTGYTFTHYVIKNTSIIFTNIGTETMPINGFELTAVYQINHYDFTYNDFFGQTDLNYENYVTSGTAYPINNSLDYNSSLDLGSTVVNGYNLYQIVINSVIVYDGDTLLNTNYIVNENTLSDVISVYYTKVITTITISANGGYFDIENTMSILTLVGYFDSVITGVIEPHLENNGFVSFMLASNPYYFSQGQNFGTSDIVLSSRWHDLSLDTYTVTVSIHLQKTSFEDEEDILEDNISTYTFGNLEYLENLKPVINQYGYLFSSLVIDEDTPILDSEYVLVVTENILIGRIDIYYNRIITVITLFGNGGLFESNSSATLEVKGYFGDPINTLERPSREGFTFVVWFLNTGNIYNEGVNINFPLTSFTLSARWNINKYNITIVSHFEEAE
ncbi:MAG: InlB B-repeat-containing protein, partial [Acholeplasmatales bacterium]|nr:InlB B-repeat-containing protein [Acholeplasmatales bacterium]